MIPIQEIDKQSHLRGNAVEAIALERSGDMTVHRCGFARWSGLDLSAKRQATTPSVFSLVCDICYEVEWPESSAVGCEPELVLRVHAAHLETGILRRRETVGSAVSVTLSWLYEHWDSETVLWFELPSWWRELGSRWLVLIYLVNTQSSHSKKPSNVKEIEMTSIWSIEGIQILEVHKSTRIIFSRRLSGEKLWNSCKLKYWVLFQVHPSEIDSDLQLTTCRFPP